MQVGNAASAGQHLRAFLEYRRNLLTIAPGNICMPAEDNRVQKYAPFTSDDYPYQHELGSLSNAPWYTILKQKPEDLIDPNPFAPSHFRKKGYACWDAAVGIPACKNRITDILPVYKTPMLRGCNTYWFEKALPALARTGPLGPKGEVIRTNGPWIYDLTKMEDGWTILTAAHVWAHWRSRGKRKRISNSYLPSSTMGRFQEGVSRILVSLAYNIPLYVGPEPESTRAYPDFRHYATEVKSTTSFEVPILRAPWINDEALRFDQTLAMINVGLFIEPPPYGIVNWNEVHDYYDRWSCIPTIGMIAGWETVDMITHQPLVCPNLKAKEPVICYGMHPGDLMSPETYLHYIVLAEEAKGKPIVDDNNMYFLDWINSKQFAQMAQETPPLSCIECLARNPRSKGGPQKPKYFYKMPPKTKEEKKYIAEVRKMHKFIDEEVVKYEDKFWGRARYRLLRRLQKRNAKVIEAATKAALYLQKIVRKAEKKHEELTPTQQRLYNEYRKAKNAISWN